jgi:hypothetical protein
VTFYEGFVDFTAVATELEVHMAHLEALVGRLKVLDKDIRRRHEQQFPDDVLLSVLRSSPSSTAGSWSSAAAPTPRHCARWRVTSWAASGP